MTIYSQTGTGSSLDMAGDYDHIGQKFATPHILVGETVSAVQFKLRKTDTGITNTTITCAWYNGSNVLQQLSTKNYNTVDDLTDSFVYKTFIFNYTVSNDDFCAITTTAEITSAEKLGVEGGPNDYTNTETWIRNNSVWQSRSTDRNIIVTYGVLPSSGTRLPPPPIILGGL